MDRVIETHSPSHPAGRLARVVRELNGQRSILHQVAENLVDSRVHANVDAPQATGRLSITKPGLTTLGKRGGLQVERTMFLPEPGDVLLAADLSQIDARAVAAHCQDPHFMALFDDGRDFHAQVAAQIFGDPNKREMAKRLNHSVNYGVGAPRLASLAGVSLEVAEAYLRGMAELYPQWHQWKQTIAETVRSGALLDNGFGRKLRVDPQRPTTAGPAAVGQACARDLLMEGLLRLDEAGLTPRLRCIVHHELVLSVPAAEYQAYGNLVLECLSFEWAPNPSDRPVKIIAELGKRAGQNWAEVYQSPASV
jgi:DNA polymerase-1